MAWQRLWIVSIPAILLWINFILPHSFLCALLEVDDLWNLVSNAHVRSAIVVEVNVSLDHLVGMLKGIEASSIDTFYLYFTINTFRNGVVCRVVILGHRNGYFIVLKFLYVGIATVLYATIGMMNKSW